MMKKVKAVSVAKGDYDCADYPDSPTDKPDGTRYTQADVADYAIDAKAAWRDCRDKLKAKKPMANQ